jgi:hypothetical protein
MVADIPVSSTFEEEIERGERSRCEVDPNSEEVRRWKATRAERRATALKAHEEIMKGPAIAYQIDQTLFAKAETRNAELTDEERAPLQSRGDAVGKALAHPESLNDRGNLPGMYDLSGTVQEWFTNTFARL